MKKNVDNTRTEVGSVWYKLHADYKDPSVFWLIEDWASVVDLKNHCTSEVYAACCKVLKENVLVDQVNTTQIALYK